MFKYVKIIATGRTLGTAKERWLTVGACHIPLQVLCARGAAIRHMQQQDNGNLQNKDN
jgi:hypothetical protein